MLIKRFLFVLSMLLTVAGELQAQERSDTVRLKGEWLIEKVETKLFTQEGNTLLETKTYTSPDDMKTINAFVPLNMRFGRYDCTITSPSGTERGNYTLPQNGIFQYLEEEVLRQARQQLKNRGSRRELVGLAGTEYSYSLPQLSTLVLNMPATFYKDINRNLAVKLVYTCYYRKK